MANEPLSSYKVSVTNENWDPLVGVEVEAMVLSTLKPETVVKTGLDGVAKFTGLSAGPHFFKVRSRRVSTAVDVQDADRVRSYKGKIRIQIIAVGGGGIVKHAVVDANGFGTHTTIQDAIDYVQTLYTSFNTERNGFIVHINPGGYAENLSIVLANSIQLVLEAQGGRIASESGDSFAGAVHLHEPTPSSGATITVTGYGRLVLRGLRVSSGAGYPAIDFSVATSAGLRIENSLIESSYTTLIDLNADTVIQGIALVDSMFLGLGGTIFGTYNGAVIDSDGHYNMTAEHCHFHTATYIIDIRGASVSFDHCSFLSHGNYAGALIGVNDRSIYEPRIRVENCKFRLYDSTRFGLQLDGGAVANIIGNDFVGRIGAAVGDREGIRLIDCKQATIVGNTFQALYRGVYFAGTVEGVALGYNSFDTLTYDVAAGSSGYLDSTSVIGPDAHLNVTNHYTNIPTAVIAGHSALLDGTVHTDTVAQGVTAGSIIIGNDTPAWDELAISVPAANVRNVLGIDNGETTPSWKTALDGTDPADVAAAAAPGTSLVFSHRDHVHVLGAGAVGAIDHGSIAGLGDDDHSQYALLAGRAGGQTLFGGVATSESLVLKSTSHATKGTVQLRDASSITLVADNVIDLYCGAVRGLSVKPNKRVEFPGQGSAAGLLIGLDTLLYRSAPNVLRTPDAVVLDSTLDVASYIQLAEITKPSNPADGYGRFYMKNTDHAYFLGTGGQEYNLSLPFLTVNKGIVGNITVTDAGGLNITWSAGIVYDQANEVLVATDAQGAAQACTANDTTYLKWVSGSTLTLNTTFPSGDEILIAHIVCSDVDILTIHVDPLMADRLSQMQDGLGKVFMAIVADGLVISEDTDVTNALDVSLSTGTFLHEDFQIHNVSSPILSRTTPMVRWYHSAGAWTTDTNAEIDPDYYDDGSDLVEITGANLNKYFKSAFYTDGSVIHWVYPTTAYNTIAQAIGAPVPTPPNAMLEQVACTSVILKGSDSAFPTAGGEQWEDIRPRLGVASPITVQDHGSLSGLTGTDPHTQYALLAGRSGGQTLVGDTASGGDLTLQSTAHATRGNIIFGDANFYVSVVSSNPRLTVDANDYFHFSRASNYFSWVIGSTEYLRASAGGLYVGVDDTTPGYLHLYGDTTGSAVGGTLRLHTAADHDGVFQHFDLTADEDDFEVQHNGGPDFRIRDDRIVEIIYVLRVDFIAEYSGAAGVTIETTRFKDANFYVGVDDSSRGSLFVYGSSSENAGQILVYLGDNHDGTFHYYGLGGDEDDFVISHDSVIDLRIRADRSVEIPTGPLKVDTISEYTGAAGITAENVLLKDGTVTVDQVQYTNAIILKNTAGSAGHHSPNLQFITKNATAWWVRGTDTALEFIDSGGSDVEFKILTTGVYVKNALEIDGDLNHDGSNIGFFGATPVGQSTGWAITNETSDKVLDANDCTIDEIADVLGTLIEYLKTTGLLAA